jgi:hypothetical protein
MGNDCKIRKNTTAVIEYRLRKKHVYTATIKNSYIRTMFSVRSCKRCYKQYRWSNELVVTQSRIGKNVSTEAEDIVRIRHQATTGEDIAN